MCQFDWIIVGDIFFYIVNFLLYNFSKPLIFEKNVEGSEKVLIFVFLIKNFYFDTFLSKEYFLATLVLNCRCGIVTQNSKKSEKSNVCGS